MFTEKQLYMKKFLLSTGFLFSFFIGFGQCPDGDILFTSQAEIDAFAIDFPDCTMISFPGSVTISGDDIVDLTPLSQIVSIENDFVIDNNPQLVSIAGLENLTDFAGGNLIISNNPMLSSLNGLGAIGFSWVRIINNDALINLEGLEGIIEIFELQVEDNDALQSLSGLDGYSIGGVNIIRNNINLSSLEGLETLVGVENIMLEDNPLLSDISSLENLEQITVLFEIINNDSLTNLEGLQGVGTTFNFAAGFTISDNELLEDISAVSDFETPSSFIEITNNPSLSDCRIALLCNNIEDTDLITIENNLSECSSIVEVAIDCSFCSSEDVILTSQAEVDAFGLNTFGCDIIEGTLRISGGDIVDLTPLNTVTTVGNLEIVDNTSLENLDGLALFSIGKTIPDSEPTFIISGNRALENLDGLSQLFEIEAQTFEISDNPLLTNLDVFSNVSIEIGDVDAIFKIDDNPSLVTMDGFDEIFTFSGDLTISNNPLLESITNNLNISVVGDVSIINNDNLTSLAGLENLNTIDFGFTLSGNEMLTDITALSDVLDPSMYITISDNSNLSECDIEVVCSFISNLEPSQDILITNNAPNCNSVEEVEEQCFLSVNEQLLENTITLYPNPTVAIINISFSPEIQLQNIEVFSVTGREVFTTQETSIDFSSLTRGVYFARIQTNQGTVIKKIVKK